MSDQKIPVRTNEGLLFEGTVDPATGIVHIDAGIQALQARYEERLKNQKAAIERLQAHLNAHCSGLSAIFCDDAVKAERDAASGS